MSELNFYNSYQTTPETMDLLLRQTNHFYKQHKQAQAAKSDLIFTAKQAHSLIGALRLQPILPAQVLQNFNNATQPNITQNLLLPVYWLRSLFVAPNSRNQGVATQLVRQTQCVLAPIICFAQPNLIDFYSKLGFEQSLPAHLPAPLRHKHQAYWQQGKKLVIFTRAFLPQSILHDFTKD